MSKRWVAQDAELEIIHHGNYEHTDDRGQSVATCGARSHISPIDGIKLDPRIANVTCKTCIDRVAKQVDRAISRDSHGFKP